MTFSPDQIGDKGQRYEIRAITIEGETKVIGWANTPDAFAVHVRRHPGLTRRVVIDREAAPGEAEEGA